MRKYFISILIVALIVATSIFHIQSQIEEEYKNISNELDKQIVIINQPLEEILEKSEEPDNTYIIMRATAYTKSIEEGTHKGITKSGTQVSRGTVSVDPKLIPLGTKLYIEGYGEATALDTGGAIKGNRIDLYMETKKEAFEFGRQVVRVWILQEGE